jgi:hypothetical protein
MEGTVPIRVHDEKTGRDVTSIYLSLLQGSIRSGGVQEYRVRIGAWQGACSGEPTCVMSFPGTTYFRSRRFPNRRYLVAAGERDLHGSLTICKDRDSLSYNDPDHPPESHFGLPADGHPPCLKQIVVNDAANVR